MQLFQRRRWVDPDRLTEGLAAFVHQLVWINEHTGLEMAAWRRTDGPHRGAILATTTYDDHGWFLAEVVRLQTLTEYGPINEATAALTIGEDAFERWDSSAGLPVYWDLGDSFTQVTVSEGTPAPAEGATLWRNAEGAEGRIAWLLDNDDQTAMAPRGRWETWTRSH